MKVLLLNGSPHKQGCTYTALCEVANVLNQKNIETEIFYIGTNAISPCRVCRLGFLPQHKVSKNNQTTCNK